MARQQEKAASKVPDTASERRRTIERLITNGKLKEAFKEAKFYYHKEASPENHLLVEQTYLLRIKDLIRGQMGSAAREVATSMLEFGVRDAGVLRELIVLLPQLGLAEQALSLHGEFASPELKAQLQIQIADRALLHPEEVTSQPELVVATAPVRQALAALDANNEAQALEFLQAIPRSSPMADWRYFVRGLVAFRHNDFGNANANWDRLDPKRPAKKIATGLALLGPNQPSGPQQNLLRTLEVSTFGEPVLGRIAELRSALEGNDWTRAFHLIPHLRKGLGRIEPSLVARLTDIVLSPLAEEIKRQSFQEAQQLIRSAKAALEPLPWDPNWNRFEAVLWEGGQGDPDQAIDFWRKYLKDLEQCGAALGDTQRVQAMVLRRIGGLYSELATEREMNRFQRKAKGLEEYRKLATEALQESLRHDPSQKKTHELLVQNHEQWGQPKSLIEALEGLIKAFPDDVDALRKLIHLYRQLGEPEPVLSYVARFRALRPLDPTVCIDEAWGRLERARHLALNQCWEEGRAEFAIVEQSLAQYLPAYRWLSRKAAFEFGAGDPAKGEEFIDRTRASLKEPTVGWLSLAAESIRYDLPNELQWRFQRELSVALDRKVATETAGLLADLIHTFFVFKVAYQGSDSHQRAVLGYLKRTTRLKYQESDLRKVCSMLDSMKLDEKLHRALLKRGRKLYPKCPYYLLRELDLNANKDMLCFNSHSIRKQLEKALALAEASPSPEDTALISEIKGKLIRLEDLREMMGSFPFRSGRPPNSPSEFIEMLGQMMGFSQEMPEFNRNDDEPDGDRPSFRKRKPR